jgi:hypothetical protein
MANTVQSQGRTFVGMVHPYANPVTVDDRWVYRVHMFDVPTPLREFASGVITPLSGDEWWTIGEFRYADGLDYVTAVARWRRAGIEYGIEGD